MPRTASSYPDFNPHSPKGVTYSIGRVNYRKLFQPTLPEGSDYVNELIDIDEYKFQPTLPEGSDFTGDSFFHELFKFQPTLPEGSDRDKPPFMIM